MKIALFVHCFFPTHYHGTESYTLALAKNLRAMGHDAVVVSTIPPREKPAEALITQYEYQGIPVYCIDKNRVFPVTMRDTYYQPQMLPLHRELLQRLRPDIIHVTHLINHTATLLDAARELAIPAVATFTDFFGFCLNSKLEAADGGLCAGPNPQRTNCFACYTKFRIRNASQALPERALERMVPLIQLGSSAFNSVHDLPVLRNGKLSAVLRDIKAGPEMMAGHYRIYRAVIAPTRFLRSAYEKNGTDAALMRSINFGVDLDRSPKQLPPASTPIRFGFVGQIAPHKGTALLVEAFCRLPAGKGELHIYGAEDQAPAYTHAMKARSAGHEVFFHGTFPAERMRQVLDEIDFLVIPSTWYENSPLVLLNALASHTPVIVSDVEGMTEFLQPGKNGYAFARGSIAGLERVMREIIADPEGARRLSLTTDYPRTTLSMTEEVVEIYRAVLAQEPPPA